MSQSTGSPHLFLQFILQFRKQASGLLKGIIISLNSSSSISVFQYRFIFKLLIQKFEPYLQHDYLNGASKIHYSCTAQLHFSPSFIPPLNGGQPACSLGRVHFPVNGCRLPSLCVGQHSAISPLATIAIKAGLFCRS